MNFFLIAILPFILIYSNKYFIQNSILLNYSGDIHQKFTKEKKIPLMGGIFLLIYYSLINLGSTINLFFLFLIFLLGFFSDLKYFNSALTRLLIQIFLIVVFVFYNDLNLNNTKILLIDTLISNQIYGYIFVSFCILILINGTNFIDGLNLNVLGYYFIISYLIYVNPDSEFFEIYYQNWKIWLITIFILIIFNFFNKLFIGDSGSYLLGFIYGTLLIDFYNFNKGFSSFYIALLLWYPCFEIFFSIVRKFRFNRSPISPDIFHLHQLILVFLKKKFNLSIFKSNNISGLIINGYNFFIMFIGSLYPSNTQHQIFLIFINIVIYCILYFKLFNFLYKNL